MKLVIGATERSAPSASATALGWTVVEDGRWIAASAWAVARSVPLPPDDHASCTVYTSEKQSGFYKTYLELDSYGAQDRPRGGHEGPKLRMGTPAARADGLR